MKKDLSCLSDERQKYLEYKLIMSKAKLKNNPADAIAYLQKNYGFDLQKATDKVTRDLDLPTKSFIHFRYRVVYIVLGKRIDETADGSSGSVPVSQRSWLRGISLFQLN